MVADKQDRPRFRAGLNVSRDGGASWRPLAFPTPAGQDRPYAPSLVWTSDGVLHLCFVTLTGSGNSPDAGWLSSSKDAGATWTTPQRVLGAYAFQVRMAADPTGRTLYLTWLQADKASTAAQLSFSRTGLPIMAARSTDAGATWGSPQRVSAADRARVGAAVPQVLKDGSLGVLYYDFGQDRLDFENLPGDVYDGTFSLVLARGAGDLSRFTESVVDSKVKSSERFLVYLPDFAGLAVDRRTGAVYVTWSDSRNGNRDVFLRRSADGRGSWSDARQVNPRSPRDQYLPSVSVAPSGRVDVAYLDRRDDDADVLTGAAYAVSADRGESWSSLTLSTQLFSSQVGPGSELDLADQGTRLDLVSRADGAVVVWTDARRGTTDNDKLDVYFAAVRIAARR
ncbi:MAG: glycoside hydrolase [Actinobacteria bacterium]|nr:glycoside hydrolase [Actinomycetota bacterium]